MPGTRRTATSPDLCEIWEPNYSYRIVECKDSYDLVFWFNLQNSYDCLACHDSYNLNFLKLQRLYRFFLSFDCRSCQNCFMCYNLRNKADCIRNKQYGKVEYEKELKIWNLILIKISNSKAGIGKFLKRDAVHRENLCSILSHIELMCR